MVLTPTRFSSGTGAPALPPYTPGLCRAILAGAEEQLRLDRGLTPTAVRQAAAGAGTGLYDLAAGEEAAMEGGEAAARLDDGGIHPSECSARLPQSIVHPVGGLLSEAEGPALLDEEEAFREHGLRSLGGGPEFWDDISGAALPADAVRAARAEEVAFMEGWKC